MKPRNTHTKKYVVNAASTYFRDGSIIWQETPLYDPCLPFSKIDLECLGPKINHKNDGVTTKVGPFQVSTFAICVSLRGITWRSSAD